MKNEVNGPNQICNSGRKRNAISQTAKISAACPPLTNHSLYTYMKREKKEGEGEGQGEGQGEGEKCCKVIFLRTERILQ
jgi:hypothetical protein